MAAWSIRCARKVATAASSVIHCLNGNLLRALIGFGWLEDGRVARAIELGGRAITGEGLRAPASRPGPADRGSPAPRTSGSRASGAPSRRSAGSRGSLSGVARPWPHRALEVGVSFLLSRDLVMADYPMGRGNTRPNGSWFRLGFPWGYVADVLENLEALCELGCGGDARLRRPSSGCWRNRMTADTGATSTPTTARPGSTSSARAPSKWVTLRACRVRVAWITACLARPPFSEPPLEKPYRTSGAGPTSRLRRPRNRGLRRPGPMPAGAASGRPFRRLAAGPGRR